MTDLLRPSAQMPRAPERYDVRDQVELRRAIQMALDTVAVATGNPKISLAAAMEAVPAATAVAATDRFLNLTAAGVAQTSTATLIRDYALGISGGVATIPENVSLTGNVALGNASSDTLTIAPNAVTWSNNPTHSANHTFSGNVTVVGAGVFGVVSVTRVAGLPLTLNAGATGTGTAHVLTRMQNTAGTANVRTWDFRISAAGGFEIRSVVDAGSTVINALTIAHATGNVSLAGVLAVNAATPSTSTALITTAGATGVSSLRIPHGVAPSSPVNGDVWSVSGESLYYRNNGMTQFASWTEQAAVADATDATTVITQLNDLLAKLRTINIIAT